MIVKFVELSVGIVASGIALLAAISVQNRNAMETFYRRHASAVFAFAHRRLNNVALADEAVNDTLLQVCHSSR
jgi:DNA-directed RNA polymerase specialized sigma24 family protein